MSQHDIFVVCMGIATVFVGLICIVILCKILSALCNMGKKSGSFPSTPNVQNVAVNNEKIENRQEIIAAVTAVCAEEMGADISALRVISFKKI